jgi:hypothetical protein
MRYGTLALPLALPYHLSACSIAMGRHDVRRVMGALRRRPPGPGTLHRVINGAGCACTVYTGAREPPSRRASMKHGNRMKDEDDATAWKKKRKRPSRRVEYRTAARPDIRASVRMSVHYTLAPPVDDVMAGSSSSTVCMSVPPCLDEECCESSSERSSVAATMSATSS